MSKFKYSIRLLQTDTLLSFDLYILGLESKLLFHNWNYKHPKHTSQNNIVLISVYYSPFSRNVTLVPIRHNANKQEIVKSAGYMEFPRFAFIKIISISVKYK